MSDEALIAEFLSLVEVEDFDRVYAVDISDGRYFGMPLAPLVEAEKRLRADKERSIAYFSMEYGLASSFYNTFRTKRPIDQQNKSSEHEIFSNFRLADYFFTLSLEGLVDLPIYSGGLGVLAGDTLKTMADYRLPCVGVGMLWNTGYFKQKFWFKYGQAPEKMHWDMHSYPGLIPLKNRVKVSLASGDLYLKLWKYYVYSCTLDHAIPLILLDANIPENNEEQRHLTDQLYRSESTSIQIVQRAILGMGGALGLAALGYRIETFHLNEGHAVFAFIEKARGLAKEEIQDLSRHFVYTCHTPVAAGHDRYSTYEVRRVLKPEDCALLEAFGKEPGRDTVSLTLVAMNTASAINSVAESHQRVMRMQFPVYKDRIQNVTNGVHSHTWISESFMLLLEKYGLASSGRRLEPAGLARVSEHRSDGQFRADLWQAHQRNKVALCGYFEKWKLDPDVFTVCWARRIAAYKRPSLILQDTASLIELAKRAGPLQVILAGKAHPKDNLGFTYINQMLDKIDSLAESYDYLRIIMLENYDISLARLLVSGVDVWLNNPLPPFEASGTSGMKAILNAVLQMSTLDGWVVEAEQSGIGRIFGYRFNEESVGTEQNLRLEEDSKALYRTLEELVRLYYATNRKGRVELSSEWIDMMVNCISTASRFNTCRMIEEYMQKMWKMPG